MLNREELIALVEDAYFANVDNKNLEPAVACFAEDAELRIQSAHVSHVGHDQIRRMFRDFMGTTKIIYHGEPLMHMAPVARVCHQMLRLRLGRGNG